MFRQQSNPKRCLVGTWSCPLLLSMHFVSEKVRIPGHISGLQGGPDQAHPTTQEATGQGERQARACPEALPPGRPRALAAVQSSMIISVVIIMNDCRFWRLRFSGQAARASVRQEAS